MSTQYNSSLQATDPSSDLTWGLKPKLENIPPEFLKLKGCNWRAIRRNDRPKPDKVPCFNGYNLSTTRPDRWPPLSQAIWEYQLNGNCNGIGLLADKLTELVFADLDNCLDNGKLAPWAQDIVDLLNSRTEVSPSGEGLRIICRGTLPAEFNDQEVGIEVYDGSSARYLTLTGHIWEGRKEIREATSALAWLHASYSKAKPPVDTTDMPHLLKEAPVLPRDRLEPMHLAFIDTGVVEGFPSRSEVIHSLATKLYQLGYDDPQVLTLLAAQPWCMTVAMEHREGDWQKGLKYLWEGCKKVRHHRRLTAEEVFSPVPGAVAWAMVDAQVPEHTRWVEEQRARRGLVSATDATGRTRLRSFRELRQDRSVPEWLVEDYIPERGVGLLFGPSDSYKSFLLMELAACVAAGRPFHGQAVSSAAPVAYLAAEGNYEAKLRFEAVYQERQLPEEAQDRLFVSDEALDLSNLSQVFDYLDQASFCSGQLLGAVVVDTLGKHLGEDEDRSAHVVPFMQNMERISQRYGCVVILADHTGHVELTRPRGSKSKTDSVDFSFGVTKSERGGERRSTITCDKMKSAERPPELTFRARKVELLDWTDPKGRTVVSLVLERDAAFERTQKQIKGLGDAQEKILEALKELTYRATDMERRQGFEVTEIVEEVKERTGQKMRPWNVEQKLEKLCHRGLVEWNGSHAKTLDFIPVYE